MAERPFLSIVVPAYNEEAVIGRFIERVRADVDRPGLTWEAVIVDDGSADAVAALAPHLTLDGFAFDVELLYLARLAGFRIREVGITCHCRQDSRVRVRAGLRLCWMCCACG